MQKPDPNWTGTENFILSIHKRLITETSEKKSSTSQAKKLDNERNHNILNYFFKNHWKSKFKTPEFQKEKESGNKKS